MITKDHPLYESFLDLCCRLSPENLSCDGECSPAEVRDRLRVIYKKWDELENEAGIMVTEDDIWKIELNSKPY